MSMFINKEEMLNVQNKMQEEKHLQYMLEQFEKKIEAQNKTSRNIIRLEDDMSPEGILESGKIAGRTEALRILWSLTGGVK